MEKNEIFILLLVTFPVITQLPMVQFFYCFGQIICQDVLYLHIESHANRARRSGVTWRDSNLTEGGIWHHLWKCTKSTRIFKQPLLRFPLAYRPENLGGHPSCHPLSARIDRFRHARDSRWRCAPYPCNTITLKKRSTRFFKNNASYYFSKMKNYERLWKLFEWRSLCKKPQVSNSFHLEVMYKGRKKLQVLSFAPSQNQITFLHQRAVFVFS